MVVTVLTLGASLLAARAAGPAGAQTFCTADVRSIMTPQSGPPGTPVQLSWNFGAPGPLIIVSWDDQALLNGVAQPKIDDCFRGVEIVVPANAKPGPHTVKVDCAFCLVAFSYGSFTFTATGGTATPTAATATPRAPVTATAIATATPTAARPPDGPRPAPTVLVPPGPPRTGSGGAGAPGTWGWLAAGVALLLMGSALAAASRQRGR